MDRLGPDTLDRLPDGAAPPPPYDRRALAVGIVHLGLGAFHRAHQAVYTDDALARRFGPWGIRGVSLRGPGVRDRLRPQAGLYTVVERDPRGERLRVVGCMQESFVAPEEPAAVLARLADPAVRVVTLTVTEKGYHHDPATGVLRAGDPEIRRDLGSPGRPRTPVGLLVRGLDVRRRAGAPPPTVLSCDNLPDNGRTLKGLALAFAGLLGDDALARWIEAGVAFPCTMVDRIVPATTPADLDAASARLGLRDEAAVVCEPFRQWVIEDAFCGPRPAWEAGGAEFVADVRPYEEMKLRLLNGSHSALAYLGGLAGIAYVHEAMREPDLVAYLRRLMAEEVAPTLDVPADLAAYREALIERFANPALGHRTAQIAMDGSQKLPQRLLGTARDQLRRGGPIRCLTLAVAAWIRHASGTDGRGRRIEVDDPLADRLRRTAEGCGDDSAALARAFLGVREVFGDDLPREPRFAAAVTSWLAALTEAGARATVARCLSAET